ncbi:MAG: hypothetical protein OEV64_07445 [Desulfobulbaceae bacterium]|nr:hypothetical protein [Desulfobulbaceae bacterium]
MSPYTKPSNTCFRHFTCALSLLLVTASFYGCAVPPPEQSRPRVLQRKDYRDSGFPATRRSPSPRPTARSEADTPRGNPQEEMEQAQSLLLPNLTLVSERIDAYEQKNMQLEQISSDFSAYGVDQAQTEQLIQCRREVADILNEYQQVKQKLLNKDAGGWGSPTFGELFVQVERRDIAYLENDCNALSASLISQNLTKGMKPSLASLKEAEEKMIQAADNNDYDGVLEIFSGIPEIPPEEERIIFNRLRGYYGEALIKNGRFEEAITVFADLLAEFKNNELLKKQFTMTKRLADLYFSTENQVKAKETYNEFGGFNTELMKENEWARLQLGALDVSDHGGELRDYAALLKKYLAYIPSRDGYTIVEQAAKFSATYPFSAVASIADRIQNDTKAEAEKWYSALFAKIDNMIAQQEYQEAQLLLERIPPEILTTDKKDILKAKANEITVAEAIEAEKKRLAEEQSLQENWNKAILSLDKKLYDEAIEIFSSMKNTPYAEKAEKYIGETIELAVQDGRRRAAELFIRSTKTSDLENKKMLLLSSRRILVDILKKYPQTNLTDKVNGNIEKIESEIKAIDPSLLNTVEPGEPDPNLNVANPL